MTNSTRIGLRSQLHAVKESKEIRQGEVWRELLSEEWLVRLEDQAGDYRDRVFTPQVTLKAFLGQALSEDGSCQEAVAKVLVERLERGLAANSYNTGPYCKARQRLPLLLLEEAVRASGQWVHRQVPPEWQWQGYNVKLVDGTTVRMADTEANQEVFPQPRNQKSGLGFPIARLVGLLSLSSGSVIDYALGPNRGKGRGELSLLSQQLGSLEVGDLLLGDRYYSSYALIAYLVSRGIPVVFQSHAQRRVDFRCGQRLGVKDHVVEWTKPATKPVWMSQSDYRALPETILVRELAVGGKVYVTTLLDAQAYPKKALAKLYALRWTVELDLRTIKTELQMEMLRCQTPQMVKKEIAVHLLAYNGIRAVMAQAAQNYEKSPRSLSFKASVQLLRAIKYQLLESSQHLFHGILHAIASTKIGQRKRPPQPRAIKRRPKPYPRLREPRPIASQRLVAAFPSR